MVCIENEYQRDDDDRVRRTAERKNQIGARKDMSARAILQPSKKTKMKHTIFFFCFLVFCSRSGKKKQIKKKKKKKMKRTTIDRNEEAYKKRTPYIHTYILKINGRWCIEKKTVVMMMMMMEDYGVGGGAKAARPR